MSDTSTNLQLSYLASGQAQKHVTVNESLRRLDAVVQIAIESATTSVEPGSPTDGATYIVPSGKSGSNWSGFANNAIGYYRDGAWEQIKPREGWLAWVKDTGVMLVYDGSAWSSSDIRDGLGLGDAALKDTGASGDAVPLLNAANTWSANQLFSSTSAFQPQTKVRNLASDANAAYFMLEKSRNFSAVQSLDSLGTFMFRGYDGDNTGQNSAWLQAACKTSPGSGYVPSYLNFFTTASAGSTGLRLRVDEELVSYGNYSFSADNSFSCGTASKRSSVVYSATGAISTSDSREKTDLRPLNDREIAAVRRVVSGVGLYQWLDAVQLKGEGARLHCGVTAQDVQAAFCAEGLEAERYGLFCADPVLEEVEVEPGRVERVKVEDPHAEPGFVELDMPIGPVFETRPKIDPDTGEQMIRLGVRYDQLFAMALGAMLAEHS